MKEKIALISMVFLMIFTPFISCSNSSDESIKPDDCSKYTIGNRCYQYYFKGITADDATIKKYVVNADKYRDLVLKNVSSLKNPMWSIKNTGEWVIYYHIEEWKGPVTAKVIKSLTGYYEKIANDWMETLQDFDSSAPKNVKVKVFGFVFNKGVQIDKSFYDTYGGYPIVTNWNDKGESSPWKVVSKKDGTISDQNWYNIKDFTTLKVVGNQESTDSETKFSPVDWNGYKHPENVDMFFTKFWHLIPWDAVAQRQYLKIGGNILDYENGIPNTGTMTHEMGHCFFHDDMYSEEKYPDNAGLVSVMNKENTIQDFDKIIQRMIWEAMK